MARTFFELHNKQNLRNFLLVGVEIEGIEGWRAWASSGSGDATEVPIPSTIIVSTNFLLVGMVVEVEGWRACTSLGVEVRGPRGEKEEKKKQKSYWSFQREIGYEGTGLRVWRYRCGRVWWYSMLNTPRFWAASSAGIWGAEKRNRIYWDVFTSTPTPLYATLRTCTPLYAPLSTCTPLYATLTPLTICAYSAVHVLLRVAYTQPPVTLP